MPLESRPEAPQDQSQNPAADLPRAQETLSQVSEPVAPGPYSTGPLDEGAVSDDSHAQAGTHYKTLPLQDVDAPPVPPLDDRSVVGDRYRVVMRLGSGRGSNFYRVSDGQGYRQCWACGSTASLEGDTYCVECGAQLTGRYYRLQEFNLSPDQLATYQSDPKLAFAQVPRPVLENSVTGVPRIYDALLDPSSGRAYIVWEEVYGRTLASWVSEGENSGVLVSMTPPGTSGLIAMEEPGEEQALGWMAQAADLLAELHSHGITGCNLSLNNLVVQPGDRLSLLDPVGCTTTGEELAEVQTADVRTLAAGLESWYIELVGEGENGANPDAVEGTTPSANLLTGPLTGPTSPLTVLADAKEGAFATSEEFAQALYNLYESSKPLANLQLWHARGTDVGKVRQINEDSVMTLEANALEHDESLSVGVYVVADGMGGHQSGEVASSIAVRTIGSVVNAALISPLVAGDPVARDPNSCALLLQQAVMEANRRITDLARERHSDLGTTVTAAIIVGNQLTVANIGDSRTYLWRDGQLAVVTRDHSLVAQLVALGQISPEDVYTHPRRNEIFRALGDSQLSEAEVDTFTHALQPGDAVLLCSDGLWDFVRDPDINDTITRLQDKSPQAVCRQLIERANNTGGEDNISTIFVRLVQLGGDEAATGDR